MLRDLGLSTEEMLFWERIIPKIPIDMISYLTDLFELLPESAGNITKTLMKEEELLKEGDIDSAFSLLSPAPTMIGV